MQVDALLAASWKNYKQVEDGYCWREQKVGFKIGECGLEKSCHD